MAAVWLEKHGIYSLAATRKLEVLDPLIPVYS
jgi:hypothetical protein